MKKLLWLAVSVIALALLLNFRWVHASAVVTVKQVQSGGSGCPQLVLDQARSRLADLFGSVESEPLLACLSEPLLGKGHTIGTASFAPGLPSVLIFSAEGITVDVIAHEWAHAELAERTSVLWRTYSLPTWFDEGLAMQVDHRKAYGLDALNELEQTPGLKVPTRVALSTPGGFFQPGKQGRLHYAWSRREVTNLLRDRSLHELIHQDW